MQKIDTEELITLAMNQTGLIEIMNDYLEDLATVLGKSKRTGDTHLLEYTVQRNMGRYDSLVAMLRNNAAELTQMVDAAEGMVTNHD